MTPSTQGQGGPRRISTFEQFVRFMTDASGLERTFRLLQAITQILCSYEPLRQITLIMLTSLTSFLLFSSTAAGGSVVVEKSSSGGGVSSRATPELIHSLLSIPTLLALRSSFALGRRFFRVGRFLDSFRSAWKLFTSPPPAKAPKSKENPRHPRLVLLPTLQFYLAIFSTSFNGLYLLLETLHFPEVLLAAAAAPSAPSSSSSHDVGERQLTTLWGPDLARTLHVEGQRFWFFALVCGVAAGMVKWTILGVLRAVPSAGSRQNIAWTLLSRYDGAEEWKDEIEKAGKEQEERQARERKREEEFSVTSRKVGRRVIADFLDLALPGTVVGWVDMGSGMVGVCMLASTWLTGLEVWERCGGGE